MATVTVPVKIVDNHPTITVKFVNPKNNKSITVPDMLIDTGWDATNITSKVGRGLSLDPKDASVSTSDFDVYVVSAVIGSAKPILTSVKVGKTPGQDVNVFGNLGMRIYGSFVITAKSVTITDSTLTPDKAFALAMQDYNKYTYVAGYPQLAKTEKQAALGEITRSNSIANWRNRI